jgi:hypothetical protein
MANRIFEGTGIKITLTGERHLGAVIGSEEFRDEYIRSKVSKWVEDIEQLSTIANDEPQLAYAAYTKALSMRWCFLQRTIPNIKHYFEPLEETIREKFIPAVIGRRVTDAERKLFSLPVRLGGMGIQNPVLSADTEFRNSYIITKNLTSLIENQEQDLSNYDADQLKLDMKKLKNDKEQKFLDQLEEIKGLVNEKLRRQIELLCEKGAGAMLSALPVKSLDNVFDKQSFRDAIRMRYDWNLPDTPKHCACGDKYTTDHIFMCKNGGYVSMRHDNIRNLEASLLREVCKDVKVEPNLLPIGNTETESKNQAAKARLDVSAIGVWSAMERTFLDVRVMHMNSPSYMNKSPEELYHQHEQQKKRAYNHRIIDVEKGSFSPLVFSTTGGMGPECTRFHKRLAELISVKRGESYADTMNYIRTRTRISILRSSLIAVRGERGKRRRSNTNIQDVSFNLIPERDTYEV